MKAAAIIFMYSTMLLTVPLLLLATLVFFLYACAGIFVWVPISLIEYARGRAEKGILRDCFLSMALLPYAMFAEIYGLKEPNIF